MIERHDAVGGLPEQTHLLLGVDLDRVGSGRDIGEHLTIADEAWEFVVESLAQAAE